jgi:hypothetical protein
MMPSFAIDGLDVSTSRPLVIRTVRGRCPSLVNGSSRWLRVAFYEVILGTAESGGLGDDVAAGTAELGGVFVACLDDGQQV